MISGIEDINFEQRSVDIDEIPDEIKALFLKNKSMGRTTVDNMKDDIKVKAIENKFRFMHRQFDQDGQSAEMIPFTLEQESQGTQKLFDFIRSSHNLFSGSFIQMRKIPTMLSLSVRPMMCSCSATGSFDATRYGLPKNKYNVTDLYSLPP